MLALPFITYFYKNMRNFFFDLFFGNANITKFVEKKLNISFYWHNVLLGQIKKVVWFQLPDRP